MQDIADTTSRAARQPSNQLRDPAMLLLAEAQKKSTSLGVALAFFLGPLGIAAIVGILACLVLVPLTAGLALLLILPACAVWAMVSVEAHNARINRLMRGGR